MGLALTLGLSAAHAQTPTWTNGAQTVNPAPTNDTGARATAIASDAAGNGYVIGVLQNGAGSGVPATRAFGSTSLSSTTGFGDGFVAKLSPSQQWAWAVRVNSTGEGLTFSRLAATPAGDVYAGGVTQDDNSPITVGTLTQASTSGYKVFVTRLTTTGQPQWIAVAPLTAFASATSRLSMQSVSWDAAAGNIVVTGIYQGSALAFGSTTLPSAPLGGMFVARLSTAGQWLSAVAAVPTNLGTTAPDLNFYDAAVGPQGQVAVAFRLRDAQLSLGTTTISAPASTSGGTAVVAQLSAANQWQWATVPTNSSNSLYYTTSDMKYDPSGNLWLVARSSANGLQLGSNTIANTNQFVVRLSAAGQWGVGGSIGASPSDSPGTPRGLAVDGQGNAVVTGQLRTQTSYTFGSQVLTTTTTTRTYVARFSAAGQWQYAQLAPTATNTAGNADYSLNDATVDASGNLLAAGSLTGTAVFGTSTLVSAAYGDAIVVKLANAGVVSALRQKAGVAPLALFPNPAAAGTLATLRLPAVSTAALPVTLRDALGRAVRTSTVPTGRLEGSVSTAGLAPGLYLLEVGAQRAQLVVE
ncbi:T9SS type A sorting domain-containing protein [Hymenobacter chitinivorans]|uniref:Putative secreted protein (Por secretion system target) n=1 Tax=Hymenobacter chitinivorans DSM 11115 TaxID=1121954 RepID=A0A2M9BTP4_9BACT|nr:T9SS type A sorting domain-containing protein [Hymenobacter chitinivorans]PJJ61291.1 putative secreted protein (Por secretion system target) [Hymenobacter chitinivorans DSM 11115]